MQRWRDPRDNNLLGGFIPQFPELRKEQLERDKQATENPKRLREVIEIA